MVYAKHDGNVVNWFYQKAKKDGMSEIAKDSGLSREALYKALRPDSQPRFDTIARVCKALGLSLSLRAHAVPKRRARKVVAA